MPGSKSDPVVLDPLQTIVEVGWGIGYLSASFKIDWDETSGNIIACDVGGSYPSVPHTWASFKKTATVIYPAAPSLKLWLGGQWVDTTGHSVIVNRPTLSSFSYSDFQVTAGSGSNGDWIVNGGRLRSFQPSGASLSPAFPGGVPALDAAQIDCDFWGDVFTGAGQCTNSSTGLGGGRQYATCTGTTTVGDQSSYQSYSTFSIARSGFSATVDSKPYDPVAMNVSGGNAMGTGRDHDAVIFVLFKRRAAS